MVVFSKLENRFWKSFLNNTPFWFLTSFKNGAPFLYFAGAGRTGLDCGALRQIISRFHLQLQL